MAKTKKLAKTKKGPGPLELSVDLRNAKKTNSRKIENEIEIYILVLFLPLSLLSSFFPKKGPLSTLKKPPNQTKPNQKNSMALDRQDRPMSTLMCVSVLRIRAALGAIQCRNREGVLKGG